MTDDTPLPFDASSSVHRKKGYTVDFSRRHPVLQLPGCCCSEQAERKLGVCRRLADAMPDRRDADRIRHAMFEMVMARVAAIACGYEDANDLDRLRHDPLMKLAGGRCPQTGELTLALAIDHHPAGECAKQDRCGAGSPRLCLINSAPP